jgi:predicted LPLAT superfamily acyltransferase
MASWEGKSAGTPLGYRIFVIILKRLGVFPAYFVLRFVAFYFLLFSRKSNPHIRNYFRRVQGYGKWQTWKSMFRNYYLFGQTILDKVVIMSGMKHPFSFEFDGEENLVQMANQGEGGLLLSAHAGNYEIAGHLLQRLNTAVNLVMFDGEQEQIKAYLEKVTGKRKLNIILIKNDLSHIYAINEALKKKELVTMHADRFVEGNKTITRNIMGRPAPFPLGPFVLATTFKVPVSFVFAFKESRSHYHLFASPAKTYAGGERKEQLDLVMGDYVKAVEEKVKQYPIQWYNYYDFWKKEV